MSIACLERALLYADRDGKLSEPVRSDSKLFGLVHAVLWSKNNNRDGNRHVPDQRIDVYLVCNAKYHDTNFARLELLKLLAEHEDVDGKADTHNKAPQLMASLGSRFVAHPLYRRGD